MRPRIVVLRALGLGDLLTALPALRAIAGGFPDHRVQLVTGPGTEALAEASGAVDEALPSAALAPLASRLAEPAVAVNLHGRGPESHRLLTALRADRVIAFGCIAAGVDGPRWRDDEHEVRRWCRLLSESGVPADPRRLDLGVSPARGAAGATLIHPGAASAARRWAPARFAAVARHEAAKGRPVLISGGRGEVPLARWVGRAAGLGDEAVIAGRTDLIGLARIVAGAERVVCADTGVAHLATAVATPSVVIFGPTPPALWGPPGGDPRHVALWAGDTGDPHAPVRHPALDRIAVADVLSALDALPVAGSRTGTRETRSVAAGSR